MIAVTGAPAILGRPTAGGRMENEKIRYLDELHRTETEKLAADRKRSIWIAVAASVASTFAFLAPTPLWLLAMISAGLFAVALLVTEIKIARRAAFLDNIWLHRYMAGDG